MERHRFETLRDYLHNIPSGAPAFCMNNWWECGMAACAFGHASLIPEFQEAGLERRPSQGNPRTQKDISFKGRLNWLAVEEFFDINADEVDRIFDPTAYDYDGILPNEVADRIQELLDESS